MPLHLDDLPISQDIAEQIAADHFDSVGTEALCNLVLVVGQLDPLELVGDQPRWNDEQRTEILRINEILKEWKDED